MNASNRMAKTEGQDIGTHIAWKRSFRGPSKERMERRRPGRVCVVPAGGGHTGDPLEREVADSLVFSLGPFRTVSCSRRGRDPMVTDSALADQIVGVQNGTSKEAWKFRN